SFRDKNGKGFRATCPAARHPRDGQRPENNSPIHGFWEYWRKNNYLCCILKICLRRARGWGGTVWVVPPVHGWHTGHDRGRAEAVAGAAGAAGQNGKLFRRVSGREGFPETAGCAGKVAERPSEERSFCQSRQSRRQNPVRFFGASFARVSE